MIDIPHEDIGLNFQPSPGLFVGATPEWQLAAQKVAQGDAFKDGLPTTDGTSNGPVDYNAAARIAYQHGAFDVGNNLLQTGLQLQQLKAAASPSEVLGPSGSGSAPQMTGTMPLFQHAISSIESGGNYGATGPTTRTGDQALGRYQVMGQNVGPWTKEILGQALTPQQFLASPQAQDAVFNGKFGQYLKQTGNPRDAASMWFTGKPYAQGVTAQDQLGTTGAAYVDKFMDSLRSGAAARSMQSSGAPAITGGTPPSANSQPPTQIASNGDSDMPVGSQHPYGQGQPTDVQRGTRGGSPFASPPSTQIAQSGQIPPQDPASSPTPNSGPTTPYASNGSNLVDPTLGGLVTPEMLQKYGSYGV